MSVKTAAVARACTLIETAEQPDFDAIAAAVGMSRFHFQRVFKAVAGLTPKAYADASRAARVREQLGRGDTVTAAIFDAGFNSSGRFYANASQLLGMTPTSYRAGGQGISIRFGIGQCSLGAILVAAFERWMATVIGFVEAPGIGLDLPLDIRGTAFQQRVWQALRDIPVGSTASYAEIAERIGAPRAARAVAGACAANTLAVAIPCHRVLRQDGSLSGYRWGVERKQALLEREAQ